MYTYINSCTVSFIRLSYLLFRITVQYTEYIFSIYLSFYLHLLRILYDSFVSCSGSIFNVPCPYVLLVLLFVLCVFLLSFLRMRLVPVWNSRWFAIPPSGSCSLRESQPAVKCRFIRLLFTSSSHSVKSKRIWGRRTVGSIYATQRCKEA